MILDNREQTFHRLKGLFERNRHHEPVLKMVRFLAQDPWFSRAVCPDSDAVTVSEEFVFPLVLQALAAVRGGMKWPPPPMDEMTVDRLAGIPRFARALIASGLVTPDADGLLDLSGIGAGIALAAAWNHPRWQRERRKEKMKKLKALGMKLKPGCRRAETKKIAGLTENGNATELLRPFTKKVYEHGRDQTEAEAPSD
jgi:hypothetical protein